MLCLKKVFRKFGGNMKVNGLNLLTFGDKNKKAIVFLHGFPYNWRMWEYQINHLSSDYFCVAYDIRGLGESEIGDGQYTMEGFVEDLKSIIESLSLNKPALCGLSMGGYISLRAVEKYQDLFGALILCDTRSNADDDAAKLRRQNGIIKISKEGVEPFVKEFVPGTFGDLFKTENKDEYEKWIKICASSNPIGVKGCLLAMLGRTDTTSFLSKINIPTLVVCGSFDALTPPEYMRDMAAKIPSAEFAVVPRAGHMSPIENPGFVNDAIKGFLDRNL